MELKVICKRLITTDLDGSVTEGEYGADIVGITVPRFYGAHDLSAFSFRITAVSSTDESVAEQVLTMDKTEESSIHLLWNITSDFTVSSGKVMLILAGVNPDNTAQIKFISEPVTINDDSRLEFIESPTLIEQAYNQVQLEVQKAIDAADRAEEAASTPVAAEIFPATEEKLGGVKSGNDISVADDGTVTVNSVNGKKLAADVPENAVFTDTVYDDTEIRSSLAEKADKEEGKGLSANDLTDELKADYDSAVSAKHSHENKAVLDEISSDKISLWNSMTDGGRTIGEASSYSIIDAAYYPVMELHLYGKSVQNGPPTPENPVDIISVCDSGTLNITSDNGNDISVAAEISSALPLRSVGDVCDELIYNADGTGKIVKRIGKYTFTGNENFLFRGNRDNMYMYSVTNAFQFVRGLQANVVCDKYKNVGNAENWQAALNLLNANEVCVWNNTDNCTVYFGSSCSDLESFKAEVAGTAVVYQLAEPTEIALSAAEITALKKLYTYDSVTNIYNNANACMSIKYCNNRLLSEYVLPLIKSINN
ncbi:MAG: hypothetical protein ACI4KG_00940 [Oscillospiraceae bacterium]